MLDKVVRDLFLDGGRPKHRRTGAVGTPAKRRRQSFALEAMEPRLLLSADAHTLDQASASAHSITGGAVGVAIANAHSDITDTTKATINENTDVLAGNHEKVIYTGYSESFSEYR